MQFFAFVKPRSMLEKRWKAMHLTSGIFLGVVFSRNDISERFESAELTADQIAHLNKIKAESVQVEMLQISQ